jgi:hypothetical protein
MSAEIKYTSPIFLSHINDLKPESLEPFLKLKNIVSKTENNYKMISYDKSILSSDLISTYGLYRSVVINSKNKVVSYAPPKSFSSDSFVKKYLFNHDSIVAEEFIEGTMINVFWDETVETWEISTRNTVSANSSFYQETPKKTFRAMFLEACNEVNLSFENLNKNYCYSFVLQHPENRIVVPFKKPQLYLVAAYFITSKKNSLEEVFIFPVLLDDIVSIYLQHFGLENSTIQFPKKYTDCDSYTELIEKYASMNTPYHILGVVIYNKTNGERTKIRNPVYEQVRQLRGNQPKLQYQYLHLRNQGKIADFLKYFPENKRPFGEFRDQVHLFTNTLFSNYISCYIKKEKPLIEYPEQYRIHMFNLHRKYLNELKEKKLFVTNTIVKKYVNEMHPSLLMYTLNYLVTCEEIVV